jgi:hypothetical protein
MSRFCLISRITGVRRINVMLSLKCHIWSTLVVFVILLPTTAQAQARFALPVDAGAQAASEVEQTAKAKASIGSRGVGPKATVTIEMRDGTTVKGYISETQDASFTLTDARTKETATIAFADVSKVDKGFPRWAKIVIGGVVVWVALGAVIWGLDH